MDKEMISTFVGIVNVLVGVFALCSIIFIVREVSMIFKFPLKRKHSSLDNDAELLIQLAQATSPEAKAGIFVSLMASGYILIHKIINAGLKYDDSKQRIRFKKFLTPTTVRKLNTMGENTK